MIIKWYCHGDYICTTDNASAEDAVELMLADPPNNAAVWISLWSKESLEEAGCSNAALRRKIAIALDESDTEEAVMVESAPTTKSVSQYAVIPQMKLRMTRNVMLEAMRDAGWTWETYQTPEHPQNAGARIVQKRD